MVVPLFIAVMRGTGALRRTHPTPWNTGSGYEEESAGTGLGAFILGAAEFVMMGILPKTAAAMGVSIPFAGNFISAYALVCASGP